MIAVSRRRALWLAMGVCLWAAPSLGKEWQDFDVPPSPPRVATARRFVDPQVSKASLHQAAPAPQPVPDETINRPQAGVVVETYGPDEWIGPDDYGFTSQSPWSDPHLGAQGGYRDPFLNSMGDIGVNTHRWLACHGWVRAEYLGWFVNGMRTPPLITESPPGTPRAAAGVLPAAETLFGGSDLFTSLRSGGRIRFGTWLDDCNTYGVEGDYFDLGRQSLSYTAASDPTGNPILGRPFVNINPGVGAPRNDAELVSFPGVLAGSVTVTAQSRLNGAGARFLYKLSCCESCSESCGRNSAGGCGGPPVYYRRQVAIFAGYRYLRLGEGLQVNENLTSLDPLNPGTFSIFDRFGTVNTFNGLDLGGTWEWRRNRWSLDLTTRVALGGNRQNVSIQGSTTSTVLGVVTPNVGGLLAQTSNIGQYSRNVFSVVPEFNLTAGYQVRPRLRLIAGYSLMYWTGIIRPGDQIDTSINPNLIPPQTPPVTGPQLPAFNYHGTELLVHGFNVGLDSRW